MLSTFESALLERHLRDCPSCRSFAVVADRQTTMLRASTLEVPLRRVMAPAASIPRTRRRRAAAMTLSACAASFAAAIALLASGGHQTTEALQAVAPASTAPVLVAYAARPSPASPSIEVPRLSVRPASYADGPVRGIFSQPTRLSDVSAQLLNG
jgi:predicted anti-sigma-YlaC factor YlaD